MKAQIFLAIALLTTFFVGRARAQPPIYVAASGFAEIKQFGSSQAVYYYGDNDSSMNATGGGGGFRIGTFVHPRVSIELGVEAGTRTTTDVSDLIRILATAGSPIQRQPTASTQFLTVSTVLGYHPPAKGRLRSGYLAGLSFVRGTYMTNYPGYLSASATAVPAIAIYAPESLYTATQRNLSCGGVLGFEAAVDMTRRLTIVPEVRALVFSAPFNGPGIFLIRPGVSVRWGF